MGIFALGIDKELDQIGRFRATSESLDLAKLIASSIGQEFDRNQTESLANNLHEKMYEDLINVLDLDASKPQLHSGIFNYPRAFSAKTIQGDYAIGIDIVFDFWVFAFSTIISICTFTVPTGEDKQKIAYDTVQLFQLFQARADYYTVRRDFAYYLLDDRFGGQLRSISALIARANIVFVLCHELAHVVSAHHETTERSHRLELEADAIAADYFLKIIEYGQSNQNTYIHIDSKIACAPLILTMIFELYETWLSSQNKIDYQTSQHPPALERTRQLQGILQPHLNDEAQDIIYGATKAVEGLHDLLGLTVRQTI